MSERQRRRSQKNEKILCFDSKIVEKSKSTMHKLPSSSFSLSKSFLRFHSTSQLYNYNSVFDSFDASASTQSGFSWSSSLFMSTFMTRNLFLMFSTSPNLESSLPFPTLHHLVALEFEFQELIIWLKTRAGECDDDNIEFCLKMESGIFRMMHDNAHESNDMNKVFHLLEFHSKIPEVKMEENFMRKICLFIAISFFFSVFLFHHVPECTAKSSSSRATSGIDIRTAGIHSARQYNRQVKIYLASFFCPKLLMFSEIIHFLSFFKAHNEKISEKLYFFVVV